MLRPISKLTAFPMEEGEVRGFCTKIKAEGNGAIVSAPRIEEYLTTAAATVFGGNLTTRQKFLDYPSPLASGTMVEVSLRLLFFRKVARENYHLARFRVEGISGGSFVVRGTFVLAVPW